GGTGTISGNVTNTASVNPGGTGAAGTLIVTGNYTQTSAGTLNIDLGGTAGGQFDQLKVSGTSTLDGTLQVGLINGYSPAGGDSARVLTFNSRTNDFASKNGLTFTGGVFAPVYGSNNLTLTAKTGPAVLVVNSIADNTTDTTHLTLRDAITLVNNAGNPS